MIARRLVACAVLVAVVVSTVGCSRPRKPPLPSPSTMIDLILAGKDIYDWFDQPTYSDLPLLCEVLNKDPRSIGVVGGLAASTRDIHDRTQRSPGPVPFLVDDALEGARDADCHWSPLVTPGHVSIDVDVTAYEATPATRYARAAFAKVITDDIASSDYQLRYETVSLGSATCIGASGNISYGVLRKDNVLMAVTISTPEPVDVAGQKNAPGSPTHTVLAILDDLFGDPGTGAPEPSDDHDDCV